MNGKACRIVDRVVGGVLAEWDVADDEVERSGRRGEPLESAGDDRGFGVSEPCRFSGDWVGFDADELTDRVVEEQSGPATGFEDPTASEPERTTDARPDRGRQPWGRVERGGCSPLRSLQLFLVERRDDLGAVRRVVLEHLRRRPPPAPRGDRFHLFRGDGLSVDAPGDGAQGGEVGLRGVHGFYVGGP